MLRQRLVNSRGLVLTEDTARALTDLEQQVTVAGWRLMVDGPHPEEATDLLSLVPAGREVHLSLVQQKADDQRRLEALWGFAIPLGFTPWTRYPRAVGTGWSIFHFYGPWQAIPSRLMAEGRGHLAWPSLCCAAQVDTGTWRGNSEVERFVQAQLHRLGHNCGPVDGEIGPRTSEIINRLGLANTSLAQLAEHLRKAQPPAISAQARQVGHLALPGRRLGISVFGGIRHTLTPQGATLHVDGPGRLVVDIGETT